ncbi:MAG: allantoinase AllB [Chitinophagaceae bacterium]|nr:allantoinase AllB [Chitinophagaceae bacterium]MBK9658335.1 allantoinase AllB [Chitinophagaceae bacterium]MBK9938550.1 allantoinase AllB [Chitinophagaceae bacterium]
MNIDAAILSNRTITPGGMQRAVVLMKDGKIIDVVTEVPQGDFPVTDVGDNVLMAGIVDPHVHINEPGRTEWEGFHTATKAALAGGITALVEMPLNASPVTTTAKAFDEKIKAAQGKLHTNCGFWGGIIPGNQNEIVPLIEKGVLGFKAFLTHSGIDEFPNVTEADLRKAMPVIAKHGLPLLVHCELSDATHQPLTTHLHKNYLASRPKHWEDNAIALMIRLCEEFNCRTHIVHLSSADSIEQIAKAKQKGLPLSAETGQHYLYFNAEEIAEGRTEYKCAPPIREKKNNERLWQALKEGIIDFVATDHSPAPPDMKEIGAGDFMKAWGGISSLQFSLPVLWTAAKNHGCNLDDMAKWLCEKPAQLPQLKWKGKIAKGYDADLVIWNPEQSFKVDTDMIHHKHKITPYLNEELYGVVTQTWLGGEKVFDAGKFLHLNKGHILYHE